MPRTKLIPDANVYATIRRLIAIEGEKAASFGNLARLTGLSGPTLVQRYGAQDDMIRVAVQDGWAQLEAMTIRLESEAELTPKGAQSLLKQLQTQGLSQDGSGLIDPALFAYSLRDAGLRTRAANWRQRVERALALRLGGGEKGQEAASMMFAAWQGQLNWLHAGGKAFRLKDAIKRLS